jgi:AcrR family transcriptional regulator
LTPSGTKGATAEGRILDAAVDIFAKLGFGGTSTRAIARRAGVNEATLYRCFGRKRDLFTAALERELGRLGTQLDSVRGAAAENPQQAISLLFQGLARVVAGEPELMRLLQFGVLELGPALRPLCRKHVGKAIQETVRSLLHGSEQAMLPCLHAELTVLSFLATILVVQNFYGLFAVIPPTSASTGAITAECANVWRSVLVRGGMKCEG